MADLKVWGILPGETTREQVVLDYTVTGNATDGYDIVISKKSDDEKEYDLNTLNWTSFEGASNTSLNDATCISVANWDLIGSNVDSRVTSCLRMYKNNATINDKIEGNSKAIKNVTTMWGMFEGCTSLTTVPLFDTSNVTTMYSMFYNCSSLTTVPEFDTHNVNDMRYMLSKCTSITTIPQFDISNVTNASYMFDGCTSLTTILELDTSKVTNMYKMFSSCTSLNEIGGLDLTSVTEINNIVSGCTSLKKIKFTNVGNNLLNSLKSQLPSSLEDITMSFKDDVTDLSSFLRNRSALKKVQLDGTQNLKYIDSMFTGCTSLVTISEFDTQNVVDMSLMFFNCIALTTIPEFNTRNVTNMSSMFRACTSLTTVPEFNTQNVTDMDAMFYNVPESNLTEASRDNILKMCLNSKVTEKKLSSLFVDTIDASKWNTLPSYNDFINAGWSLN